MRKNDARKLKYNELTELRQRGISAVQDGQPVKVVVVDNVNLLVFIHSFNLYFGK